MLSTFFKIFRCFHMAEILTLAYGAQHDPSIPLPLLQPLCPHLLPSPLTVFTPLTYTPLYSATLVSLLFCAHQAYSFNLQGLYTASSNIWNFLPHISLVCFFLLDLSLSIFDQEAFRYLHKVSSSTSFILFILPPLFVRYLL